MSATVLALAVTLSLADDISAHFLHGLLHSSHISASPPRQAVVGHSRLLSDSLQPLLQDSRTTAPQYLVLQSNAEFPRLTPAFSTGLTLAVL